MKTIESLPTRQSMKQAHKVRRFRRGNAAEHGGRRYIGNKSKPWKNNARNAA